MASASDAAVDPGHDACIARGHFGLLFSNGGVWGPVVVLCAIEGDDEYLFRVFGGCIVLALQIERRRRAMSRRIFRFCSCEA